MCNSESGLRQIFFSSRNIFKKPLNQVICLILREHFELVYPSVKKTKGNEAKVEKGGKAKFYFSFVQVGLRFYL